MPATALLLAASLTGCVTSQPQDVANVCEIFEERRAWYKAAKAAEERWQVPISVNMAFIYQESTFRSRAKPPRSRLLWILPGPRPSSAFGYAQALDSTWAEYETRSGNRGASRAKFSDAIDFVAWYNAGSTRQSRIDRYNAEQLYLAYHEGNGGYQRRSFANKGWLLSAASRVQDNADRYAGQLSECRSELDKSWWRRLLS